MYGFKLLFFFTVFLFVVQSVFAMERGLSRNSEAGPFGTGQYRALIIGNNNYRDPEGLWKNLATARQGARSMARLLKETYGFSDVTLIENASRREIIFGLTKLAKRVEEDDYVLIYYAGHGYLDEDTNRGYWIPVDAIGDDITTYIRNTVIRDEIIHISEKTKHTLLISDSCFSGSLLRGSSRSRSRGIPDDLYYQKLASKKSVQIYAAGGLEFVDDNYRNSGHSPFTYFLLSELESHTRGLMTMSELSTNVSKEVANNVRQTPVVGVLYGSGDELGEFIFARVDGAANLTINLNSGTANNPGLQSPRVDPSVPAVAGDVWLPLPRF